MRLDKLFSELNICSRSEFKKLSAKGLITVNGTLARKGDLKVDPDQDTIFFKGEEISYEPFVYYILNKPAGCVTATEDRDCRTVMEVFYGACPQETRRDLFPVGRLDKDTEGLLLITNDGPLGHTLTSPSHHVEKKYYARIAGIADQTDVEAFHRGLDIGEKKITQPAKLEILGTFPKKNQSEVYITISEGKFHQVKRMCQKVGKEVLYLRRVSFGPLTLTEDLELGQARKVSKKELYKSLQIE